MLIGAGAGLGADERLALGCTKGLGILGIIDGLAALESSAGFGVPVLSTGGEILRSSSLVESVPTGLFA
jgi:hypothetical protein